MLSTTVETTGFAELDARLRGLQNLVIADEIMRDAMLEAAEGLADKARANAASSRLTGHIQDSIRVGDPRNQRDFSTRRFKQSGLRRFLAVVGATAGDARFLEHGTYRSQAHPFLRPAVEADLADRENGLFARFAAALRRRLG